MQYIIFYLAIQAFLKILDGDFSKFGILFAPTIIIFIVGGVILYFACKK